jgi:hypothetical protein
VQTLCVRPDEVGSTGTWSAERRLTGIRLGGVSTGTDVQPPRPRAEAWTRIDGSLQGELRAGFVLDAPSRTAAGADLARTGSDLIAIS